MRDLAGTVEGLALSNADFLREAPDEVGAAARAAIDDGAEIVVWTERSVVLRGVPEGRRAGLSALGFRDWSLSATAVQEGWMLWKARP